MDEGNSITLDTIDQYAKQRPFYNSKHFKEPSLLTIVDSIEILNADDIEESIEEITPAKMESSHPE